ncbi:MAG: hypothetical protein AAFY71_09350 [Bacteroidota bacterium]
MASNKFLTFSIFLISILAWQGTLLGQNEINSKRIKKFDSDDGTPYPYMTPGISSQEIYIQHDPCLKLSPGNFSHVWRRSWSKTGNLLYTEYDLFLEELSSYELDISREEDIFHLAKRDTFLRVFTSEYDYKRKANHIRMYEFGLKGGKEESVQTLWLHPGSYGEFVRHDLSPDGKYLLLYQPFGYKRGVRSTYLNELIVNYEENYSLFSRSGGVKYSVFNLDNTEDVLVDTLSWKDKKSWIGLRTGIDNGGHVYASLFDRKGTMTIYQKRSDEEKVRELSYDELPSWRELMETYSGFQIPRIGANGKVYITLTEKIKSGKLRGIKSFRIVTFDFNSGDIITKGEAEITSSLKVQVNKARQDFGMRPNKRFDYFQVRDLIEMPDESLILVAQKYILNLPNNIALDIPKRGNFEEYAEELVIFEFDEEGNPQQAIIIPSSQRSVTIEERLGIFYHMEINKETKELKLLTREASGDRLKGPERLYYRMIDIEKGNYSDRKLIYKGKRRDQYFLKAYTEWLNEDLLSFMVMEGLKGQVYLVTVNVNQEEDENQNLTGD